MFNSLNLGGNITELDNDLVCALYQALRIGLDTVCKTDFPELLNRQDFSQWRDSKETNPKEFKRLQEKEVKLRRALDHLLMSAF